VTHWPSRTSTAARSRFDRVLSNPPFSLNYSRESTEHTERFRWGWTPEGGKKADLMFLQHMVAVLKDGGIAATVMPHGVLFRGGTEVVSARPRSWRSGSIPRSPTGSRPRE
jgi:type I restriction enzyme M protein